MPDGMRDLAHVELGLGGVRLAAGAAAAARRAPGDGTRTHRRTLTVRETVQEISPGVRQKLWTFGGAAPGPVLRGRAGGTFGITLVNDGSIGHSVDFHAGALAPDRPSAFHVVGGQFDTVYHEGAHRLRPDDPGSGGAQVLDLAPAQGGFVELAFPPMRAFIRSCRTS
ncbi:cupredoxin domain-containing protein [Streptomyces carminius]|uniref:hypothetical protein n=1 Tax=Streptomyces carminius TaxID=2665496 RepID=UPI0018EC7466|nr:hypothetical protein [Streptomyces carminius]